MVIAVMGTILGFGLALGCALEGEKLTITLAFAVGAIACLNVAIPTGSVIDKRDERHAQQKAAKRCKSGYVKGADAYVCKTGSRKPIEWGD